MGSAIRAPIGSRPRRTAFAAVLALPLAVGGLAAAQPAPPAGQPPALMNRDEEVALALSACPADLAGKAAVYALGPAGYVKVRDSGNGFTAIVQHSTPGAQEPQCMDEEGARTFLQRILKTAELRAQGRSSEEIRRIIAEDLARGVLQPPTRPGVDYMLSTRNRVTNFKGVVTPFPPHVMIYAPYLRNRDIGVDKDKLDATGNPAAPAFVASEGTPFALVIVPVGEHAGMAHAMPDLGPPGGE